MTRALELLYNDELSIVEIAQAVGYYGDGYFQKAFKETYGISPGPDAERFVRHLLKIYT